MATGDIFNNIQKMRCRLKEIKYTESFDVKLSGHSTCERTSSDIKKMFCNMKSRAKEKYDLSKKTGGGPVVSLSPVEEQIVDHLLANNRSQLKGLETGIDSMSSHPEKLVQDLHVHEVPDVCSEVVTVQEVFEGDNLIDRLAEGQPAAYLPIYHYAFTSFSQPVAKLILDSGIELFGKSDARFMEAVYKILRDVFGYKPPITKEQFFAKGFAERKVIMCSDILHLVKQKHRQLKPAPPKTTMKTSVRPKSAAETKALPAVPTTKPETKRSEPVRHLSSAISHPHPIRHVAGRESTDSSESSDHSDCVPRPILSAHNGIKPQSLDNVNSHFMTPSIKKICPKSVEMVTMPQVDNDEDTDTSIVDIQANTRDSLLQSPISIPNMDIANLYQTVENLSSQMMNITQTLQAGCSVEIDRKLNLALSKIENLTARLLLLENRMSIIEAKMDGTHGPTKPVSSHFTSDDASTKNNQTNMGPQFSKPAGNQSSPEKQVTNQQNPVKQAWNQSKTDKLEDTDINHQQAKPVTKETLRPGVLNDKFVYTRERGQGDMDQYAIDSTGLFSGPGDSFAEELQAMRVSKKDQVKETTDFSLNYSPIRRVNNDIVGSVVSANEDTFALETEDDARRASTPTFGGTFNGESSLHCDISHLETKDTVSRIHNMMKETSKMMKNKAVVHPVPCIQYIQTEKL